MIDVNRTRFILDGKIISPDKVEVLYDKSTNSFTVFVITADYAIQANLLNIEIVQENPFSLEDPPTTITWTQFILGKKNG